MAERPLIQRARDGYDAFGKGDLAALQELWSPDLRWHVPGTNDLAGTYEGVPAVFGFLQQVLERSGGTLRVEPLEFFADDTHAAVLVRQTATRGDQLYDIRHVHIWRYEDDRVVELWDNSSDVTVDDAFWG